MDPCTPSVNAILSVALQYGNEEGLSGFAALGNNRAEPAAFV
jgi:hypothetical protein